MSNLSDKRAKELTGFQKGDKVKLKNEGVPYFGFWPDNVEYGVITRIFRLRKGNMRPPIMIRVRFDDKHSSGFLPKDLIAFRPQS